MIAPEPFFQERGTPFSEFYRIKALTDLGHDVDLATYSLGTDIEIERMRIFRIMKLPGLKHIKVGPSWTKLPLDFLLFWKAFFLLCRNRYDVIHTHEEGGVIGAILKILFKKPHIFDMHSSLSEQFINFNISRNRVVLGSIRFFEKFIIKHSDCVIVICPHLEDKVYEADKRAKVIIIENTINPAFFHYFPARDDSDKLLPLQDNGKKRALYIGTFEHYQGMDILVGAAQYLRKQGMSNVVFLCIGGNQSQQIQLKKIITEQGMEDFFIVGERVSQVSAEGLIDSADVLLSPRKEGVNTPLKIYSYLHSGKPIIATNLVTHTQILNDDVAFLAEPDGESFGKAVLEALQDEKRARMKGNAARKLFEECYAYEHYRERVKMVLENIIIGKPKT